MRVRPARITSLRPGPGRRRRRSPRRDLVGLMRLTVTRCGPPVIRPGVDHARTTRANYFASTRPWSKAKTIAAARSGRTHAPHRDTLRTAGHQTGGGSCAYDPRELRRFDQALVEGEDDRRGAIWSDSCASP